MQLADPSRDVGARNAGQWPLSPLGHDIASRDLAVALQPLLVGQEHANFFETRATEYSKAASRGSWPQVWTSFETMMGRRQSREQFVGWMADRYVEMTGAGRGEAAREADATLRFYCEMLETPFGDDRLDWMESDAHAIVDEALSTSEDDAAAA